MFVMWLMEKGIVDLIRELKRGKDKNIKGGVR